MKKVYCLDCEFGYFNRTPNTNLGFSCHRHKVLSHPHPYTGIPRIARETDVYPDKDNATGQCPYYTSRHIISEYNKTKWYEFWKS